MHIKDIIIFIIDVFIVYYTIISWLNITYTRETVGKIFPAYRFDKKDMLCYKITIGIKYSMIALIIIIVANYLLQIMLA